MDKDTAPPDTNLTHQPNDGLGLLLTACIRHERKAQRELYEKYSPFLFGIIRRYTNDTEAAQEIQSDAFYRIFSRLDQFRYEGAFEGWIRRIAVHAISDHFRKSSSKNITLLEDSGDMLDYNVVSGYDNIAFNELLAMIHGLPETQRAVFNLYVFEQYPHNEIASLLSISSNNSRWHLNDARRRLKEQIIRVNRGL